MVKWTTSLFYTRLFWFTVCTIVLAIIFAFVYIAIHETKNENNEPIDFENFSSESYADKFIDAFYFSWVTQTTIGYGDFSPNTKIGKGMVILQSFLFWSMALSFAVLADEKYMLRTAIPGLEVPNEVTDSEMLSLITQSVVPRKVLKEFLQNYEKI